MIKNPAFFDRFTLWLTDDDVNTGSHQGPCDDDIAYLLETDDIKKQLETIPADDIRAELKEYGAWDDDELADDDQNLARILWIACGNAKDG